MAWTTPAAPGASTLVTNTFWNAQITQNFLETAPAKVTTKGDLTPATGANALTRLAVGSNNSVLVADSTQAGGVRWSSTSACASGGVAQNVRLAATLTASANGDGLYNLLVYNTINKGALTSLATYGVLIDGANWSANGAGSLSTTYGLYLTAPTVGASNYNIYTSGSAVNVLGSASGTVVFIGDTTNAFSTAGLTINQGSATDEAIALKNSGVAHGMTTQAETDTFGVMKLGGTGGVLQVRGYGADVTGLTLQGIGTSSCAAKSAVATAAVNIFGAMKSGTTTGSLPANSNVLTISESGFTRFIFDSDGDLSADAALSASAYDQYDDAALCRALDVAISDPATLIEDKFRDWMRYGRADLERARLVTFNDDGHHFVNYTKLARLHTGAIWQTETKVRELAAQVQALTAALADSLTKLAAVERRLLPGE